MDDRVIATDGDDRTIKVIQSDLDLELLVPLNTPCFSNP